MARLNPRQLQVTVKPLRLLLLTQLVTVDTLSMLTNRKVQVRTSGVRVLGTSMAWTTASPLVFTECVVLTIFGLIGMRPRLIR